jgi:hypothetical protein
MATQLFIEGEFLQAHSGRFNTLNAKLNAIWHLLALLGANHILHVSRIRVNLVPAVLLQHLRLIVSRALSCIAIPIQIFIICCFLITFVWENTTVIFVSDHTDLTVPNNVETFDK